MIVLKAGDSACFPAVKGKWYAIHSLQNFSHKNAQDTWSVAEKAKEICELVDNERMLQEERKKIRDLRDKLGGRCNEDCKYRRKVRGN